MCLSGERKTKTITNLLKDIFGGADVFDKTSLAPKIIFVDTCHGNARNHLDVYPQTKSNNGVNTETTPKGNLASGRTGQYQDLTISHDVENFIIIHSSVQQNHSYQTKDSSYFLKGLYQNTF
jgi:hypothetical protein